MNRSPSRFIALIVSFLAIAAPAAAGSPQEEVDFRKMPAEGLWFRSRRTIEVNLDGKVQAGDVGTQRVKQTSTYDEAFTEKVLTKKEKEEAEIEPGVTAFTRDYLQAFTISTIVTDRMLIPHQDRKDELYSALDFYATLKDGELELKLNDPVEGPPIPAPGMAEELAHRFTYPNPIFPETPGPRRIGETWSLAEEAIKKLFPRRPAHRIHGTLKVRFSRIEPAHPVNFSTVTKQLLPDGDSLLVKSPAAPKPVRCAVLEARARLELRPEDELPLTLEFAGTFHYSLVHHLVVESSMKGTIRIQGTLRIHDFDFPGTYSDTTKLEFYEMADGGDENGGGAKGER
jgi:hypothetical protein